jgi:hypothetical protein
LCGTRSIDADVTQFDIAIQNFSGPNTGTTISLYTNVGNALGSFLGSWTLGTLPDFGTGGLVFQTITGVTGTHLNAGGSYFLVAQAAGEDWNAWNQNNIGVTGPVLLGSILFTGILMGTFDVIGTPTAVPLPALSHSLRLVSAL